MSIVVVVFVIIIAIVIPVVMAVITLQNEGRQDHDDEDGKETRTFGWFTF